MRLMWFCTQKRNGEGFTLIEVLVSISILITVMFAPLSIITQYLIESALTEDHVKAGLLAQEVIEYVRYDRDSNFLSTGNWFEKLHSRKSTLNEYIKCVMTEDDWLRRTQVTYCDVHCTDGTTTNDCGSNAGFVSGVSKGASSDPGGVGTRLSTAATCDGAAATAGTFTTTLTIIIPSDTRSETVQYASLRPCVSWVDRTDAVHKIELEETLFKWVTR